MRQRIFGIHKARGIYLLAEELLASQETHCSVDLVTFKGNGILKNDPVPKSWGGGGLVTACISIVLITACQPLPLSGPFNLRGRTQLCNEQKAGSLLANRDTQYTFLPW